MSVQKECPICHKSVDARGYNSHVRACEADEKFKQEKIDEVLRIKEQAERNFMDKNKEDQEPENTDSKNLKVPKLLKILVAVVGLIVAGIAMILMLISPKSKESSKSQESQTSARGHRLSR